MEINAINDTVTVSEAITDEVNEKTSDHGVIVDGLLIKDGQIGVNLINPDFGTYLSALVYSSANTVTVANTTTETTIVGASPSAGTLTLPAGILKVGTVVRFKARGYYSSLGLAAGTLTLRIKFGSTTFLASSAVSLLLGSSNDLWELEGNLNLYTTGASGTFRSLGKFDLWKDSTGGYSTNPIVNTSVQSVDTTVSNTINITAQWSVANASNTITCTNVCIEILN